MYELFIGILFFIFMLPLIAVGYFIDLPEWVVYVYSPIAFIVMCFYIGYLVDKTEKKNKEWS